MREQSPNQRVFVIPYLLSFQGSKGKESKIVFWSLLHLTFSEGKGLFPGHNPVAVIIPAHSHTCRIISPASSVTFKDSIFHSSRFGSHRIYISEKEKDQLVAWTLGIRCQLSVSPHWFEILISSLVLILSSSQIFCKNSLIKQGLRLLPEGTILD